MLANDWTLALATPQASRLNTKMDEIKHSSALSLQLVQII
jgi:hypothetical protein